MPSPVPVIPGKEYGRLKVVKYRGSVNKQRMVEFECRCGKVVVLPFKMVRKGNTSSCGCLRRDMVAAKNRKHGEGNRVSRTPEYRVWKAIRARCNRVEDSRYGGRGITVDPAWDDFTQFLKDVGRKPSPKHTIGRIDNNKGYCPGNVRWETYSQQARNKRNTFWVVFRGERLTTIDLAERFKVVSAHLIYMRIRKGWDVEKACLTPAVVGRNQHDRK